MARPILVTGSGGCIGAWVVKRLLAAGREVVGFDLSADKRRLALLCDDPREAENAIWETGDIADGARLWEVCERHRPRAMIHLAALQVPFCKADPARGARVNVVGAINAFEAAKRAGIRNVAYASSVAATAMGAASPWLETLYGAYKVCNEQTARVHWRDDKIASVGIRPSVVYGPARDQGMSAKPTLAMLAAAVGSGYVIPFTGPVGFVHADEAAAAFILAAECEREGAAVFDLNGIRKTVEEAALVIRARVPQADIRCEGAPLPFPSDLDDAPLAAHIGDYERLDFDSGIADAIDLFSRRVAEGRLDATKILGEQK